MLHAQSSRKNQSRLLGEKLKQMWMLFQGSLPLLDSFLTNSISLQSQLHSTISCFNSFLNSLQQIADCASNTKGVYHQIILEVA